MIAIKFSPEIVNQIIQQLNTIQVDVNLNSDNFWFLLITKAIVCISGISAIITLFGIYGIIFIRKKSIIFYSILQILVFLTLLTIGICVLVMVGPIQNNLKQSSCQEEGGIYNIKTYLKQANQLYLYSRKNVFCQSQCQCFIQDPSQWKDFKNVFNTMSYTTSDRSKPVQLGQCKNLRLLLGSTMYNYYSDYSQILSEIEKMFDCAGICDPIEFFQFSNINNGVPSNNKFKKNDSQSCLESISNFIGSYEQIALIVIFVLAGIFLLNIIFSYILLCTGKKQQQQELYNQVELQQQGNYMRINN